MDGILIDNDYTKYFIDNGDDLIDAYFGNSELHGINTKNNVSEKYENEEIVEKRLEKGKIDEVVVAWKAGRLEKTDENDYKVKENTEKNCYFNGYGKPIDKNEMTDYLNYIKNIEFELKPEELNYDKFKEIYEECIDKNKISIPHNFGAVYIINLLYFKSKRNIPIYDKFAHIAVKSLYMELPPYKVYVGDAPDKNDVSKVCAQYSEYIWLLQKVFGKTKIDRDTDRALWAYGHADSNWDFSSKES